MCRTYLELLVGSLLPLLVHRGRGRTGEETGAAEEDEAGADGDGSAEEDTGTLTGRGLGTRTMGTKSDPVGYNEAIQVSLPSQLLVWRDVGGSVVRKSKVVLRRADSRASRGR